MGKRVPEHEREARDFCGMVWRVYLRDSRDRGFASKAECAREIEAAEREPAAAATGFEAAATGFEAAETGSGVRRRVTGGE